MPRTLDGWFDKRGQIVCGCGGYHFPHRKTGGACEYGPPSRVDFYRAVRQDVPPSEAMALLSVGDLRRIFPFPGDT